MTTYQTEERSPYGEYSYNRPPGSSHGPHGGSPERIHSSQEYVKGPPSPYQQHPQHQSGSHDPHAPSSAQAYPPPPITPISGSNYPPQPPPSTGSYYGLSTPSNPPDQHAPSPPLSSSGRPGSGGERVTQYTSDGVPIVPVGVSGGKMFRCTNYGPCDKVFTRSEHLARHVRKHTGERPFSCHCGKAFSRLDNLRQHAATVHADQAPLNEAMLSALAPVHAALSQRASKDQRKRGEIVEVPKNAVERPRHNEQYRKPPGPGPYPTYPPQDPQFAVPPPPGSAHGRPRTSGEYEYAHYPEGQPPPSDDAGPSRRPGSAYGNYPPMYYEQSGRPGTAGPPENLSQLPYPYRPMSSNGRDLPVPAHYSESEPPTSAHGPPQSPMYPPGVPAAPQWSSPPPPPHTAYAPPSSYPPQDQYAYPPSTPGQYGPPPPTSASSNYGYPPQGPPPASPYYPPATGFAAVQHQPPPGGPYPPPPAGYGPPPHAGVAPESPFNYHAPPPQAEGYSYSYESHSRKRRSDDLDTAPRKAPRASTEAPPPLEQQPRGQEPLWLPPTTERRSSLAISALLGSPQQVPRSRPTTADVAASGNGGGYGQPPAPAPGANSTGYAYSAPPSVAGSQGVPPASGVNGQGYDRKPDFGAIGGIGGVGENMEQKAKALLSQGR